MIHDFTYLQPGSVKEALAMLAEHADDCKVICGGQSLLIVMRQGLVQTDYLIDIKRLSELNYIKYDDKGGLKIGATTTHRAIEKSDVLAKKYPVLVDMEHKLASIQVRTGAPSAVIWLMRMRQATRPRSLLRSMPPSRWEARRGNGPYPSMSSTPISSKRLWNRVSWCWRYRSPHPPQRRRRLTRSLTCWKAINVLSQLQQRSRSMRPEPVRRHGSSLVTQPLRRYGLRTRKRSLLAIN
jgi:hypothetical protein